MLIVFWIIVFLLSLVALVKGSDWLIDSAEKIGLSFGISPFIIGVTIISVGTSFPELVSSLAAVYKGVTDVVAANAIGSNIANILLVVGVSAFVGKKLCVSKNLIDLDLPLLAASTVIFLFVAWDGKITLGESILMLAVYGIYVGYTVFYKEKDLDNSKDNDLIGDSEVHLNTSNNSPPIVKPIIKDVIVLVAGILGLVFGAKYLIDSLIFLSKTFDIATGIIAITAVAIGTSLPELLVSVKAAIKNKPEVALGNIFGSNVFNILVVTGAPGLFGVLEVSGKIFSIGLPMLAFATFLFIISGISRRIHMWEGAFYLSLYFLFIAKLFDWF
jgi:cation:H+ antiporter